MADLFALWRKKIDVNSKLAVEAYQREIPDFRRLANNPSAHAGMVDFAAFLRRRSIGLIAESSPFTSADLGMLTAVGHERGAKGVSLASQRQVLLLHTSLMMREVHELARPQDGDAVMRALRWLPELAATSHVAYTSGYLGGLANALPVIDRVRLLVDALLVDDPLAVDMGRQLQLAVPRDGVVIVARVRGDIDPPRATLTKDLLAQHWIPCSWTAPDEFVALVGATARDTAEERAAQVASDFRTAVGLPCGVGAAPGRIGDLASAVAQARQVSRVAPVRPNGATAFYRADLFAELGAVRVPAVDRWLRDLVAQLAKGPELVTTLDAFYRNDLSRLRTAAALHVHPRTLDYRLQRARELTGLDPVSVRGVRVLSTAVARALAAPPE
ncbi:helix-turn-helix domain-containing protein [Actinokineospora auranticolor]|uniref:PucR-like helix-turn-helix protein n=1 Tax=Actinokineospora auranticolor TaxID=155976 RepID=A0A2S6GC55_9PSEU|nr:helix-turn-helix domain-containing protein [Actinokineospora auranticolor]PPK62067.1 PucR-like helix-turn-helix protein [Actinokineospora auranticolor]